MRRKLGYHIGRGRSTQTGWDKLFEDAEQLDESAIPEDAEEPTEDEGSAAILRKRGGPSIKGAAHARNVRDATQDKLDGWERLIIVMPQALKIKLKRAARMRDTTMRALTVKAIRRYLKRLGMDEE